MAKLASSVIALAFPQVATIHLLLALSSTCVGQWKGAYSLWPKEETEYLSLECRDLVNPKAPLKNYAPIQKIFPAPKSHVKLGAPTGFSSPALQHAFVAITGPFHASSPSSDQSVHSQQFGHSNDGITPGMSYWYKASGDNTLEIAEWEPYRYAWEFLSGQIEQTPDGSGGLGPSVMLSADLPAQYTAWYDSAEGIPAKLQGKPLVSVHVFDLDRNCPLSPWWMTTKKWLKSTNATLEGRDPRKVFFGDSFPFQTMLLPRSGWVASTEDADVTLTALTRLGLPTGSAGPAGEIYSHDQDEPQYFHKKVFVGWVYSNALSAIGVVTSDSVKKSVTIKKGMSATLLACYRWHSISKSGEWIPTDPGSTELPEFRWSLEYRRIKEHVEWLERHLESADEEFHPRLKQAIASAKSRLLTLSR